jgi:hypothetical protein
MGDDLNNIRRKSGRHFRKKERKYLKQKLMSLQQTVRTRTLETFIEE